MNVIRIIVSGLLFVLASQASIAGEKGDKCKGAYPWSKSICEQSATKVDDGEGVIIYQFDPSWPRTTEQFSWGLEDGQDWLDRDGHAAGVAIDRKKNLVYVLSRKAPHVRVFHEDGTFVRSWPIKKLFEYESKRAGTVSVIHQIHVDGDGNVWVPDLFSHVVVKYSPLGEALLTLGTYGEPGMDGAAA